MRLQPKVQLKKKEIIRIVGSYLCQIDACTISQNPDQRTIEKLEELAGDIFEVLENDQADWVSDVIIDYFLTHNFFSNSLSRKDRAELTIQSGKASRLIIGIRNERETYNTRA